MIAADVKSRIRLSCSYVSDARIREDEHTLAPSMRDLVRSDMAYQ